MSTTYNNYIGAFLVVKKQIVLIDHHTIFKCFQCEKEYKDETTIFCPKCGNKIIETNKPIDSVEYYSLYNEETDEIISDDLYSPEYPNSDKEIYLLPNVGGNNKFQFAQFSDDVDILEFNNILVEEYKNSFREYFKNVIDDIVNDGFKYEIKFGFISYGG